MIGLASALCSVLYAISVLAAPSPLAEGTPGLEFTSTTPRSLPLLRLPYGTWRASSYDSVNDIYVFKNIRYAAPPVGNLRWAKPAAPVKNITIQDGSYGNTCPQSKPALIPFPIPDGAEDCLFLDLWVPGCAVSDPNLKLPVTVFTHGGAYLLGQKDVAIGTGPIVTSGNKMIFVAHNYRLGAFGFLAGSTMEKEAVPNTGFYDQRAAYQWVQDYILVVGGDPTKVTAWGESAGAGSLLHHITAFGGTQVPLFSKVVLESIASEVFVDRRGEVESFYQEFLSSSGCAGQSIACLRSKPFSTLQTANKALALNAPPSGFKPGPAADGAWVRQMPALELASGNYYKGLSSLILSHVSNESGMFVTGEIQTDTAFANLTNFIIPAYAPTVRAAVANFYPTPGTPGSPYATQNDRTLQWLNDTNFVCNYRYLNLAYKTKAWSVKYSVGNGFHGDDLTPTFYNGTGAATATLDNLYKSYQSYLVSLSTTGNPNTNRKTSGNPATIDWPKTIHQSNEELSNVLNVGDNGFSIITDNEALKSRCDFFLNVQAAITLEGGYVPPGGAVPNSLGVTNHNPSGNYSS